MHMINYTFTPANDIPSAFNKLYEILTLLRTPEGCPFDRKQTTKTALQSMIDEAYEYLDGVNKGDIASQREEIGDILINAFMILEIHAEQKDFYPVEALNEVCEKLVRRHVHVFGGIKVNNEEEAISVWNQVKKDVEGKNKDAKMVFEHIPSSLPPLERNYEIQKKLAKYGFEWPDVKGVIAKVHEELQEVEDAIAEENQDHIEEELGDLLAVVVNLCRWMKIRPNTAMERANRKISARFTALFTLCQERGIPMDVEHADIMNEIWDEVKSTERG